MNQAYDEMQTRTDLNRSFEIFKKHFENCLNLYAPMKQFNIVPKNCPKWFDNRLKNVRVRRHRAFQNWRSNKNDTEKLQKFKSLRSQFEDETKGAKRKFFLNKFNSCIGDSRQTYKLLNEINGKKVTNNTIPCLDSLSEKNTKASNYDIADSFNKFFINIAGELTKDIEPSEQLSVPQVEMSLFL